MSTDYIKRRAPDTEASSRALSRPHLGLPTKCPPDRPAPCYKLVCQAGEDDCERRKHELADEPTSTGASTTGEHTYRVVRRDKPPKDGSPQAFDDRVPPFKDKVKIIVQYWFFYPYDEWRAPVLAGRIFQRHAGDWEASPSASPTTSRCSSVTPSTAAAAGPGGPTCATAAEPRPHTHPLVAVAVGSHANYERESDVRAPDWTSCKGVPRETIELLSYTWNLRDRTAAGLGAGVRRRAI